MVRAAQAVLLRLEPARSRKTAALAAVLLVAHQEAGVVEQAEPKATVARVALAMRQVRAEVVAVDLVAVDQVQ